MLEKIYFNIKVWWMQLTAKQRNWIFGSTLAVMLLGVLSGDSLMNILIGTVGMAYVAIYGTGTTRYSFLMGVAYVGLYTVICLQNRIMLDALQNIILIPIYIASFYHWGKAQVKPRNMSFNQRFYTLFGLLGSIGVLYLVSVLLHGNYSILDAINTACTMFAMVLGYYGFTENWICWTINNAVSAFTFLLVLFTPTGSIVVLGMKCVFLINGLIGWHTFYKKGQNEA